MSYHNPDYFGRYLRNLVTLPLHLGSSTDDLQDEIRHNLWSIAISGRQAETLTKEGFVAFLDEVLENRSRQLQETNVDRGALFYVWFDEQACQLRGNVISDLHRQLPFGCSIELEDRPDSIVEAFLRSPYHDGIPWSELDEVDPDVAAPDPDPPDYVLRVYCVRLPR